ncbi:GWxTD domain-containing protein [candidate division KSB1 bacterium]
MKLTMVILLVVCIVGISAQGRAQTAWECYEQGMTLKEAGDIDRAIKKFDKARKKDRDFADANYELALCYLSQNTIRGRILADYALDRALKIDPENTRFLHAYGDLNYRRYFTIREARLAYEKIIGIDPENIPALEKLSQLHSREYDDLKYRVHIFFTPTFLDINLARYNTGELSGPAPFAEQMLNRDVNRYRMSPVSYFDEKTFHSFAQQEFEKSMELNDRILSLEPDNRDALYRKGLLLLETDNIDGFIGLFEQIVRVNDEDKDAYLFLGLGFARKGEHEISGAHYRRALSLLGDDERAVFESIDFVHEDFDLELWKETQTLQDIEEENFWKPKDPLLMTPFNERRMEHYGRIAEANLRFSILSKDIPGWTTDRGRIWIRYGRPYEIKATLGQLYKTQYWYYDVATFVFYANTGDYDNNYRMDIFGRANFNELEAEISKLHPDYYEYTPRGRLFEVPVDVARFRDTGNIIDIQYYFGIRLKDIEMVQAAGALRGTIRQGVFLFDDEWTTLASRIDTVDIRFDSSEYDTSAVGFATFRRSLSLQPGSYNLAIELVDTLSGNTGTFRDSLSVVPFGYEALEISDILIANDITLVDTERDVSRENITVHGNPFHAFLKEQPVYLYFEIYNLDAYEGRSRYRIEYGLRPAAEKGLLSRILRQPGEEGVSFTSDITGTGNSDNRILIVDHNITKPGEYLLSVFITDMMNGRTVERTTTVWIY